MADTPVEVGSYTIDQVAKILQISRSFAYELARADDLPSPVIYLGKSKMVVSSAAFDEALARQHPPGKEVYAGRGVPRRAA